MGPRASRSRLAAARQSVLVFGAGFPWLRHEWLSEVLMGAIFNLFGPLGLKLLKFACTAGTICFVRPRDVRNRGASARAGPDPADRRADAGCRRCSSGRQIFDFLVAVRDRRAAQPPQLARFGAALACDSDRCDLEQSPRRIFCRHRRDGRLWSNCPAGRRRLPAPVRVAGLALLRLPPLLPHLPCARF